MGVTIMHRNVGRLLLYLMGAVIITTSMIVILRPHPERSSTAATTHTYTAKITSFHRPHPEPASTAATTHTADIPTFQLSALRLWSPAVASPGGRYLAVPHSRKPGGNGIWIGDLTTGTWTKVWDHTGDEIQWLPDARGMIVLTGAEPEKTPIGVTRSSCTFSRVSLDGHVQLLTELTELCDWLVIPDGSGLAATRIHDHRQHDGVTEVRVEALRYSFSTRQWYSVFIAPYLWPDGPIGVHLSIRNHRKHWVLSYVEGATGDNSGWWINLATGDHMHVHEGDNITGRILEFSPDGKYAVSGITLYHARTWPAMPRKNDWGGYPLGEAIYTFQEANINGSYWSPDSRLVALNGLSIFDLQGHLVAHPEGVFAGWVDGGHVLVGKRKKFVLHPLFGGTDREVFRFVQQ